MKPRMELLIKKQLLESHWCCRNYCGPEVLISPTNKVPFPFYRVSVILAQIYSSFSWFSENVRPTSRVTLWLMRKLEFTSASSKVSSPQCFFKFSFSNLRRFFPDFRKLFQEVIIYMTYRPTKKTWLATCAR